MAITSPTISPELMRSSSSSVIEASERVLRAGQAPGKSAFIARAMNALAALTDELDEETLADAAGASSDAQALLKALDQPEVYAALRAHDPLLPARIRGIGARQRLLEAEGGALSAAEAATLLGITRQAVDKRRRAGTLIGLQAGKRGYLYPRWQFTTDGVSLSGLPELLADLAEFSPWMQAGFILSPNLRLNNARPIDALRDGSIDSVRQAAQSYGEHGAA
jgi:hypothetical protein